MTRNTDMDVKQPTHPPSGDFIYISRGLAKEIESELAAIATGRPPSAEVRVKDMLSRLRDSL